MGSNRRLHQVYTKKPTQELRLSLPWGHIAAKAWGSPQAPRVLVSHGVLDNAGSFDQIMPMLPDNFYYVVLDLPGHGFSSPLPTGIQLDFMNYVLAIRLVLDQLKWDNCIYIGHSLGAQLGIFSSFMYPERITKLVCLDGLSPQPTDMNLIETMRLIQDNAIKAINTESPRFYTKDEILFAIKNKRQSSINSATVKALFQRATTKVGNLYKYNRDIRLRVHMNALLNSDQYNELISRVNIPVLIVVAKSSWIADPSIALTFKKILGENSNFKVIMIPGNHDVHNNNPELVASLVSAFIDGSNNSKL